MGYSGEGFAATSARLNRPRGVSVDGTGGILIADTGNGCVRRVNINGSEIIYQHSGSCMSSGYWGDNGAATLARMNSPSSIALDGIGGYWVADAGNSVIRHVFSATQTITPSVTQTATQSGTATGSQTATPTPSGTACFKGSALLASPSQWTFGGNAFWATAPSGSPGELERLGWQSLCMAWLESAVLSLLNFISRCATDASDYQQGGHYAVQL